MHGDDVCARWSRRARARILMLTAAGTIEDRVDGLKLGADDYLAKPFAFAELVARIRALARRTPGRSRRVLARATSPRPARGGSAGRAAARADPKELGVLEVLLGAEGAVVSAEELLERVWDENADPFTNTVTVTISRLRRKLGDPPVDRDGDRRRLPALTPAIAAPGWPPRRDGASAPDAALRRPVPARRCGAAGDDLRAASARQSRHEPAGGSEGATGAATPAVGSAATPGAGDARPVQARPTSR